MNYNKTGFLLLYLFYSLTFLQACNSDQSTENKTETDSLSVIPVEVASVNRGDIAAYYSTTSTLEAEQEADVVSKVRGIVTNILVEEGDYVEKGEVLAKIEDEQYQIEAQRAKATLDRLYNDFQRNKELFDRDLIAAETYENSRFEYESQKATYELAELNLKYTSIAAPISGVITERLIKEGNLVGADQQVYRITDFDPLQAVVFVPEHERYKIKKNQQALLKADALPGETFSGIVERISPVIDPATGTFKVTVTVKDISQRLSPGMFSRIRIVYDTRTNTKMIPKSAVISEDVSEIVYVVRDDKVHKKEVKTGYTNGTNVEILEGLEDGERVVTVGQGSLQDSAKVTVVGV